RGGGHRQAHAAGARAHRRDHPVAREMNGDVRVRVLGPSDAAAFQVLRLQALTEDPVAFASSYEEERDTPIGGGAERPVALSDPASVGGFDGANLGGLAAWHREEMRKLQHKGFVWGVYVAHAHRGRGLGRMLLQAVIAHARRAEGIRQLNLTAYAANKAA